MFTIHVWLMIKMDPSLIFTLIYYASKIVTTPYKEQVQKIQLAQEWNVKNKYQGRESQERM